MTRDDIIARLRKVAALASHGVGGEAVNAAAMLDAIAAQHGIDLADLDDERPSMHTFRTGREQWRRDLFCQILWCLDKDIRCYNAVAPASQAKKRPRDRRRGKAGDVRRWTFNAVRAECTDSQFVECVAKFEILQRDYARQQAAFYRAFLVANDLLCAPDPDSPDPTEEEVRRCEEAARLAIGIEASQIRKQIAG